MEELQDSATRVEVVSRLGVRDLRNECGLRRRDLVPVDPREEGMLLDLVGAIRAETLGRIQGHQALHEVLGLRGDLNILLVPLNMTREDILEHLLWRFIVEWWYPIEELVGDNTQRPLRTELSVTKGDWVSVWRELTQSTAASSPRKPRMVSGAR